MEPTRQTLQTIIIPEDGSEMRSYLPISRYIIDRRPTLHKLKSCIDCNSNKKLTFVPQDVNHALFQAKLFGYDDDMIQYITSLKTVFEEEKPKTLFKWGDEPRKSLRVNILYHDPTGIVPIVDSDGKYSTAFGDYAYCYAIYDKVMRGRCAHFIKIISDEEMNSIYISLKYILYPEYYEAFKKKVEEIKSENELFKWGDKPRKELSQDVAYIHTDLSECIENDKPYPNFCNAPELSNCFLIYDRVMSGKCVRSVYTINEEVKQHIYIKLKDIIYPEYYEIFKKKVREIRDKNQHLLLMQCIKDGNLEKIGDMNLEFVKILQENGEDVKRVSNRLFNNACEDGNLAVVKYLLEQVPDIDLDSGMFYAAKYHKWNVVEYLYLNHGVDADKAIERVFNNVYQSDNIITKLRDIRDRRNPKKRKVNENKNSFEERFLEICKQKQGLEKVIELYQEYNRTP